jgi:hypothetical protein
VSAPTAAPSRFPYLEHRTVAQVDIDVRAKREWTAHEDRVLLDWLVAGMGRTATALHLGRSIESINARAQKLRIVLKHHRAGRSS